MACVCCRLSNSAHRRQLLGYHECSDPRWGPLCGKTQLLLQLADGKWDEAGGRGCRQEHQASTLTMHAFFSGYTSQNAQRIASQLHADGAIISSSLPKDTWLVLANIDALKPATYQPHGLVSLFCSLGCGSMQMGWVGQHRSSAKLQACSGTRSVKAEPSAYSSIEQCTLRYMYGIELLLLRVGSSFTAPVLLPGCNALLVCRCHTHHNISWHQNGTQYWSMCSSSKCSSTQCKTARIMCRSTSAFLNTTYWSAFR